MSGDCQIDVLIIHVSCSVHALPRRRKTHLRVFLLFGFLFFFHEIRVCVFVFERRAGFSFLITLSIDSELIHDRRVGFLIPDSEWVLDYRRILHPIQAMVLERFLVFVGGFL